MTAIQHASNKGSQKFRPLVVGGTLIFLLLVLILLSMPGSGVMEMGKRSETIAMMEAMEIAGQSYVSDGGSFPKNLDNHAFYMDLSGARTGKAYMSFKPRQTNSTDEVVDDWGMPFRISYVSDTELRIVSAGNDKTFGTADDIIGQ